MNNKGNGVNIAGVVFFILIFIFGMLVIQWTSINQEYILDEPVECNDRDGDIIEGAVCYEKIFCADKLKFFNHDGCEEFIEWIKKEKKI